MTLEENIRKIALEFAVNIWSERELRVNGGIRGQDVTQMAKVFEKYIKDGS